MVKTGLPQAPLSELMSKEFDSAFRRTEKYPLFKEMGGQVKGLVKTHGVAKSWTTQQLHNNNKKELITALKKKKKEVHGQLCPNST